MKPRGIWIAIGLILVTGIGSTRYVRAYTSGLFQEQAVETVAGPEKSLLEKKAEDSQETLLVEAKDAAEAETAEAENAEAKENAEAEDVAEAENTEAELAEAETTKAPGPIAQIRMYSYGEEGLEKDSEGRYEENKNSLERLEELDRQMEKKRSAGQDSSANSAKSVAETERKLWENQLNQLVDILKKELTSSEWDAFMKDQNEWIRNREIMALDALSGNSSSAVQELEYTRSLAELTRDRAYELAKEYSEVLKEAE